ncbi:unnamed protein product, partial [marine sediment metagenome]
MSDEKATHTRDIIHDVNIIEQRIEELETHWKVWMNSDKDAHDKIDDMNNRIKKIWDVIEELEKKVESPFYLELIEFKKEIAELKELLNEVAQAQIGEIEQIKEVLRELINNILLIKRKTPSESYDFLVGLLAKLSGGEKEFCVGIDCMSCEIPKTECPIVKHMNARDSKPPELMSKMWLRGGTGVEPRED